MTYTLKVKNLSKQFHTHAVLSNLTFQLEKGEILSIVGPSGSGKTTLLRVLAGLESPSWGEVFMEEEEITFRKANRRNISLVFQQPLLFPHMNVEENINYGAKITKKRKKDKAASLLQAMDLEEFKDYFPAEISGGQQQRAALARAMATEPKVILFDEPFSSLDPNLRHQLRYWLREFLSERSITGIFVTHDTEEAMIMGDRLAIFQEGTFQQIDYSQVIQQEPANPFVAEFIGGHLVLDADRFVPIMECALQPFEEQDTLVYHGVLQHVTFQNGQPIGHIFIKKLDKKVSLPLNQSLSLGEVNIYMKKSSIRRFGGKPE